MDRALRLLVVDGSRLMPWLCACVAPGSVEVEQVDTFEGALHALADDPPDAAVIVVTPCELPWRALIERCVAHRPPIPFRCWSAVGDERGTPPLGAAIASACKPVAVGELRSQIAALLTEARQVRELAAAESLAITAS